jgi:hypothetical protein
MPNSPNFETLANLETEFLHLVPFPCYKIKRGPRDFVVFKSPCLKWLFKTTVIQNNNNPEQTKTKLINVMKINQKKNNYLNDYINGEGGALYS